MTRKLIILRGPSGAGKNHYIENNITAVGGQVIECSADLYFEHNSEGGYRFDPRQLPQAHQDCLSQVLTAHQIGHPVIVVNNTFTRRWEYWNYTLLAHALGRELEIIEIVPQTVEAMRKCAERNQHEVPQEVIASQTMRFEHDPRAQIVPVTW